MIKKIQKTMLTNKKLAMLWIENEFGSYDNYLKELNKNDPVEKALKNRTIAKNVNKLLQVAFN